MESSKKRFEDTVRAMTSAEIIMAMVRGLRNRHVMIDMSEFGVTKKGVCYGCAATNTVCEISNIIFTPKTIGTEFRRAKVVNAKPDFLLDFEESINELRHGFVDRYNLIAIYSKFAEINISGFDEELPSLKDDYSEVELKVYERLADFLAAAAVVS